MAVLTTFASAVADAKNHGYPVSILLGNGFSRAFNEGFGYKRLRDVATMNGLTVEKDRLFDHAATDDFETVIHNLEHSANLIELYDPFNTRLRDTMREDAERVKHGLVEALTLNHPASAPTIATAKYISARQFLSHFSQIFTLNYDLLLYWTVVQTTLGPQTVAVKDGFRRPDGGPLVWNLPDGADDQEIFYLHGAMHFYIDDGDLRKLEVANGRIVEQLKTNLESGKYPLVVTEGTAANKQASIARSAYLTYCHTRLSRFSGALFIHGMAMSENDQHILDAIAKGSGRIEALYIGLHGDPSLGWDMIRAHANNIVRIVRARTGQTVSLQFYSAATATVWG